MRPQDKTVFLQAARSHQAWILVRRTNSESLKYIGMAGYTPKRFDCDAKTADYDVGGKSTAGLVVDPTVHPDAFSKAKQQKASECWKKFVAMHGLDDASRTSSSSYDVDRENDSPHYGCVRFEGQYIHGDYDLYDIILLKHPRGNLAAVEQRHGKQHLRGARVIPVTEFVNHQIDSPMIQHGGEAQYADHSEQVIDAFGPAGECRTFNSLAEIRQWYDRWQRKVIDTKTW